MQNKRVLIAHLAILSACVIWGLMAPIGKLAESWRMKRSSIYLDIPLLKSFTPTVTVLSCNVFSEFL